MMTKNCLWTTALLSFAVMVGCSGNGKNGNGAARVTVSPSGQTTVGVTLTQQFTATVSGVQDQSVTWSINQSGASCSPGCGSISPSGLYTAPNAPPNPATVTVTATSVANDGESDSATVQVVHISVTVAPTPANVQANLTQEFQAVAVPDAAPQTFSWNLSCTGTCGTLVPDSNNQALAVYTAPGAGQATSVQITATSTVDTTGVGTANVNVLGSRLPAGSYAFRFSGYSGSDPLFVAGNFTSNGDGTISGGVEDEVTPAGPVHRTINASTYSFASNGQGTITLKATGLTTTYTAVIDAAGDIRMVESDGTGRHGSGVIEPSTGLAGNSLKGNFVFGLNGGDLNGKRVGYAGFLPLDGAGNIAGGTVDTNDNGTVNGPTDVSGSYTMTAGIGTMTVTANGQTLHFALYGVSGQNKGTNPFTVYAVSTDAVDANHPALAGTIVFQDPKGAPYDNTMLNAVTVSNLTGSDSTGTNTNVSLTVAGSDGAGNIGGSFDQNNAGTILSVSTFTYKYSSTANGRYTVQLLGNPNANPAVAPLSFVLYASAANKGFLLEAQASDPAVLTGTMEPQKGSFFAPSEIPGFYAAGSVSSGTSSVTPQVANLQLTNLGDTVTGTQFMSGGSAPVTGTYDVTTSGQGTITLTAPPPPASSNFVIYLLDTTHFYILNVDKTNTTPNSSIVFAQQ